MAYSVLALGKAWESVEIENDRDKFRSLATLKGKMLGEVPGTDGKISCR